MDLLTEYEKAQQRLINLSDQEANLDNLVKIIEEAYRNNPDRAAQSEMMRAMHQDVALFGEAAFVPENKKS